MKEHFHYFIQLLLRFFVALLAFSLCRFFFYFVNADFFPAISIPELGQLFFYALRFDTAALVYINAIFILSFLLPLPWRSKNWYKKIQLGIFMFCNSIALLFEMIDVGFYKFAFRRSNGSDLFMFQNTLDLTFTYLIDFWYVLLFFLFLLWLIYYLYQKVELSAPQYPSKLFPSIFVFLLGIGLAIVAARGGLQLRPVMPITAANYVSDMRLAPLVSNTSLGFIFSSQQRFLEERKDFSNEQLDDIIPIYRFPKPDTSMQKENVFIIALESFGKEYMSSFNEYKGFTPFLDSLLQESFYAQHTYANGLRSTQGIVAIASGIPSLMSDPLMFSAYQSNRVDGIAAVLKKEGYQSGFFHGANEGSMEFERFAKLTGFDHYYDRRHYNNDADYDGNWGIWDDPFFQYAAKQVNDYQQPFLGMLFSLTSHHPYAVEEWFEKKYPNMDKIERSVLYTDNALRHFFKTAATMPWFKNTLFVITADHVGLSTHDEYKTKVGKYKIPIFFFKADGSLKGSSNQLMQQMDILPSVLDYLNYPNTYTAFGQSVFDTRQTHYAYMHTGDIYQIIDEEYLLLFDGSTATNLYQYTTDPSLQKNILQDKPAIRKRMETQLKAAIQRYHDCMIHNRWVNTDWGDR